MGTILLIGLLLPVVYLMQLVKNKKQICKTRERTNINIEKFLYLLPTSNSSTQKIIKEKKKGISKFFTCNNYTYILINKNHKDKIKSVYNYNKLRSKNYLHKTLDLSNTYKKTSNNTHSIKLYQLKSSKQIIQINDHLFTKKEYHKVLKLLKRQMHTQKFFNK